MKNNSRISYDALQVEGLKEVLAQVSNACDELNIHFFIVGAIARNVWFAAHDEQPGGTRDIDFAVYIPDKEEYQKLKAKLEADYNYHTSSENAYCMVTPEGRPIDLLPFGEIEMEGQVMIEGKGLNRISLEGFREVYSHGLKQVSLGNEEYTVCTIPSVVILKLIAFDDRPERRIKDVKDIDSICKSYPSLEQEYIWSNHFDLYEEDRSHDEVGMIVLGREIRKIAVVNDQLYERLIRILHEAIEGRSRLIDHMIMDSEKEKLENKEKLLRNMLHGLSQEPQS
jgi:predicted nucleotidyltransferase